MSSNPTICKFCGKEIPQIKKYDKYKLFCNSICSAKYNNAHRAIDTYRSNKTKELHCISCGKKVTANIRASHITCKCNDCKTQIIIRGNDGKIHHPRNKNVICKFCGQRPCQRPDICEHYRQFPIFIKRFGFDSACIGTSRIYPEFERVKNIILDDYCNENLDILTLCKKYKYDHPSNFRSMLRGMGIRPKTHKQFKSGYHTTWEGKQVFYRSSYELDYAVQLDKLKISYEMEILKIPYWDSQIQKQRIAIPDFYLPNTNTIVEVKSDYTMSKQNMLDRKEAFIKHGYNFKLIFEGKELIL